jgi:aminoglycoside phosphotransferase family enzyme
VAFLRRPASFPDAPDRVDAIETHFAWVFLSRDFAWKLKKPVRFPGLDLTTAQARRANCELEIGLNRRLAAETYIGVVALGRPGAGLKLECDENPADWLVKMRRLPAADTLERLLPEIGIADPRLKRAIGKLCAFYARAARAPWSGAEYRRSLARQSAQHVEALTRPRLEPEQARVRDIAQRQQAFIDSRAGLLEERIRGGRVIDAHGDLRPEHVFLTAQPQIIDCLEFSAELRQLDAAEEIAFLGLECARLGRDDIASGLRDLYRACAADDVPEELFDFYRSRRALVRAFLSAWHLDEKLEDAMAGRWLAQARWYIDEAANSVERALSRASAA